MVEPVMLSSNDMTGNVIAKSMCDQLKVSVLSYSTYHHRPPKLAVVCVGENADSAIYVRMKERACHTCGIESVCHQLPSSTSQIAVTKVIKTLNKDRTVDGILVQLPLPPHICEPEVLMLIDKSKDVDGLHPFHMGCLALRNHTPMFKPCTAAGIIELLKCYKVNMDGSEAVVLGGSDIVGLPVALLLRQEQATVTMCQSTTPNVDQKVRRGDIVIAALGRPHFVKASWLKEGAVVVDVGMTVTKDKRVLGDVDFDNCRRLCKLITPVPGGVGPMTVAMLMKNTWKAAQYHFEMDKRMMLTHPKSIGTEVEKNSPVTAM
eukprot:GHVQ01009446.1.p1 GENE.GHVQ01009446.1~~GHVQ01009446.1.p1  ORF type:complete len:319 (-),score=34.87 GHVQ01009446.1:941-1897(-)